MAITDSGPRPSPRSPVAPHAPQRTGTAPEKVPRAQTKAQQHEHGSLSFEHGDRARNALEQEAAAPPLANSPVPRGTDESMCGVG